MSKPKKELEEFISIDSYRLGTIEYIDHLIKVLKDMKKMGANTCSFIPELYHEKDFVRNGIVFYKYQ